MTSVIVRRVPVVVPDKKAERHELQLIVDGHANYAKPGEDLVCAAESILVQSYAAFLAGVAQEYLYDFAVEGIDGSGCVAISAIPTKRGWHFICGAFEVIIIGFFLLAKTYPKHVTMKINPKPEEE